MRAVFLAVSFLPALALADIVTQPTGERVPSDPGCSGGRPTGLLPTFACVCEVPGVCNIGDPCPSMTSCSDGRNAVCESTMWHAFNDNTCIPSMHDGLDPREAASVYPQTFSPTCALTFTVLSRGTARFQNAFGWYNATGSVPDPSDLHVMVACDAAPGTNVVLDVRSDPAYRGGAVGFFLMTPEDHAAPGTCAGGDCCAQVDRFTAGAGYVYYSERDLNPDHAGASSYVHLLVYDSVVWSRKFYFAWEDTYNSSNDDFTDLVTGVSGIECSGAGADCDTGMMGACAAGITSCQAGALSCVPRYNGDVERCDGLDNNCDGMVDNQAPCPTDQVCDNGACVPNCQIGVEFECGVVRWLCGDNGHCVDPACVGVSCGAGQVCRGGTCHGECEGIVCPHGQSCLLDACIDPCLGVLCASGQVCRGGICLPGCSQCDGVVCTSGQSCDMASGQCLIPGCPATCPTGTFCDGPGGCRDACEGAVCPDGQVCMMGQCQLIVADGGVPLHGDAGPGLGDGGADGGLHRSVTGGCHCHAAMAPTGPAWALVLLAAIVALRRRR